MQNLYKEITTDNKTVKKCEVWEKIRLVFPGRSVSQLETKLKRLSTPTSSPAKRLPALIKTVPRLKTPCGRPKRPKNSALDKKIAARLLPLKAIRNGRRRTTSLPGDGRVNGIVLSAINLLLPLKTDQKDVPHPASELVAAGIAEKDVGAIAVSLQLPQSSVESNFRFPPNLASLTCLRGLRLTEEEVSEVDKSCCPGDPVQDKQLLLTFEKIFGSWANSFLDTEAPDDSEVDGPAS